MSDIIMIYRCFNCEENVEIQDVVENVTLGEICDICGTDLNLDVYEKCSGCGLYFNKSFKECINCNFMKENAREIPKPKYVYVDSIDDYISAREYLKDLDVIALDTEANGLDVFEDDLLLIQLGDENRAFIFDVRWHNRLGKETFWSDPEKIFLFQNAKFDCKMLKHNLEINIENIFDLMLAERLITCGLERNNSLKAIVEKYLRYEMDKEMQVGFVDMTPEDLNQKLTKKHLEYSALDVQFLPIIYKLQRWKLEHEDLLDVAELEFNVCKVIVDMELQGIYVDTDRWSNVISNCNARRTVILSEIEALLQERNVLSMFSNVETILKSHVKLRQMLSSFDVQVESTGESVLAQVEHPLVDKILEFKGCEKQINSFGENFLKHVRSNTGRVHPDFQQIGADTGRFSCSKPNLQQIPATKEYRECFRAPKGRKLVTCDYSQQELRLLASLSGDEKFINAYKSGSDLHTETASMMFGIPAEKVEKDNHRQIAKKINFGLVYGQGARSLGIAIGVDERESERLIDIYFNQFPSIRQWLDDSSKFAQKKGFSRTLMGRKRYYKIPSQKSRDFRQEIASIGRKGRNTPIQGSAVDMMKLALVEVHERLKDSGIDAFLVNTVHDEIVVECDEQVADQVATIVQNSMEDAGRKLIKNVPIVAEACVEDYWTH